MRQFVCNNELVSFSLCSAQRKLMFFLFFNELMCCLVYKASENTEKCHHGSPKHSSCLWIASLIQSLLQTQQFLNFKEKHHHWTRTTRLWSCYVVQHVHFWLMIWNNRRHHSGISPRQLCLSLILVYLSDVTKHVRSALFMQSDRDETMSDRPSRPLLFSGSFHRLTALNSSVC